VGAPAGTVTFLFTDIEGSTRLWQEAPEAMATALERHDELVSNAIEARGGYVFSTGGDGFAAAFARAGDALAAAVAAQETLLAEPWPAGAVIRVRMALHTGEAVERQGDYFGTAVNQAARLMALAHGGQVLATAVTAQLAGADASFLDLGEHRLRDLTAPQRLFQVGQGRFPPLSSVDAVPTNLPTQRSELIGREDDVSGIVSLLDAHRLVTLTGVGGVGKTRLSLAAAAPVAKGFVDGCWFVDLSAVSADADVPRAASAALQAPAFDEQAIVDFLSQRRLLLVLDNCEHVLDGAASLAEALLATAPEVVMIATSREPLAVDGEAVYRVPVLGLPERDDPPEVAAVAPAVRLFVQRSATGTEPVELTEQNVAAVVSICRHLDGLPLAIELAAARARSMSIVDVERLLGERFRILRADTRRGQARHRTLLATLEWSHDLLGEEERRVLRRLSVFPATFDLRAAEAVCAESALDVIDALVHLVDRSLVTFEPTEGRHRLLETVRQFAADRLADAGETPRTRGAHAQYFCQLAAGTIEDNPAFRASAEMDNLRAVVEWLGQAGRWSDLVRLCGDLTTALNGSSELFTWFKDAIERATDLDDQQRIDALGRLAYTGVLGMSGFGASYAKESVALSESSGLLPSPWAWVALGHAHVFAADHLAARSAHENAIRAADLRQDRQAACLAQATLATVFANLGELDASAAAATEGLRLGQTVGDPYSVAVTLTCAASALLANRDPPDFDAGLELLRTYPLDLDTVERGYALWLHFMWGIAYLGRGPLDEAVHHFTRCLVIADRVAIFTPIGQATRLLALAHARAGRPALAVQLVAYADAKLGAYQIMDNRISGWIEAETTSMLERLGAEGRSAAAETAATLDRAAFMRLITRMATPTAAESSA
jgi:predicted ATPase/class 3 adenylate cyclase